MSILEILPEDLIPGPPDESADPAIQMENILEWTRKMSTAMIDYLNLVENASTGFSKTKDNLDDIDDGVSFVRVSPDDKTGAGRAFVNITSGSVYVGTIDPGANVTLSGAGLYLGQDKMGYYNGTSWATVINSNGTFSFKIDASNEVSHDGTSLTIKATKGKIGSSTDYFDITNGAMQLKGTGARYVYITGDTISWRDTADGGGNARITIGLNTITIAAISGASGAAFNLRDKDGNSVFTCITDGITGDITVFVGEPAHRLHLSDANSTWELKAIDLQSCTLASGSSTTIDASLLTLGTLPDARFPADASGIKSGEYTGSASSQTIAIGGRARWVMIKKQTDARAPIVGIFDGTETWNFNTSGTASPDSDTPIKSAATGFELVVGNDNRTNNTNDVYAYVALFAINP